MAATDPEHRRAGALALGHADPSVLESRAPRQPLRGPSGPERATGPRPPQGPSPAVCQPAREQLRTAQLRPMSGTNIGLNCPLAGGVPKFGLEPDLDLALGGFRRIRAVDQVLLDLQAPVAAEVAADGAGRRRRRVSGAGEGAEALDHAVALEDRGDNGAAEHELKQRLVERLADVLLV